MAGTLDDHETRHGARAGVSRRWWVRAAGAVGRRPDLWGTTLVQLARLARPGWWRSAPYLPMPDADYLRFRMITAYGWCRAWPRVAR
jgi:hypothetical protein